MSVGAVNKSTGERIPTAGNPLDKVGDLSLLHTSAKSNAVSAINEVADEVATKQDTLTFDDEPTDGSNNPVKSNGVYYALVLKQNATDNSLETDAKTIVGAINEHEGDVSTLKSGFTTLDNEVNGDATVYPYADVITIPDSIPSNLANCNVKIEPVQDLHGYDKPWVGGAWKNKCKSRSASATSNGVEFTLNDDGTVTANRTSTSENNAYVVLPSVTLPAGTYKFSGCNGGFDTGYWIDFSYNSTSHRQYTEELTATFTEETTVTPWLNVYVSYNAQNKVFSPMIRIDGTTSTYEPYENICPITGHTEARVQRDGVNLLNSTKFARKNPDSGDASNNWAIWEDYIRCNYNNSLTLNCGIGHVQIYRIIVNCFDKYMNHLGNISETYIYGDGYTFTINIAGTKYCRVQLYNATSMADYDFSTAQLEYGSTATPYVPYAGQTYTIALGDTIYGGTVDFNSGVMTVTHQITDLGDYNYTKQTIINNTTLFYTNFDVVTNAKYGDIDYKGTSLCSSFDYASARTVAEGNAETINVGYSDSHRLRICTKVYESYTESDFKTAVTGQKLCYELATPTPIQLTPQQIQLLKGQNTLTASTGQISVTVNGVSGSIGAVQEQVNGLTRAIGWDDARNIFNGIIRQGYVDTTTGEYVDIALRWVCTTKQECEANTTYTISASSSFLTRKIVVIYFDSNDTIISYSEFDHEASPVNINATITTPDNTAYIIVDIANQRNDAGYNITPSDVWDVQIEEGTQVTPYIPYHPVIGTAVEELLDKVPDAPSTDGTYSLQVTVASGVPTYSWVSNA